MGSFEGCFDSKIVIFFFYIKNLSFSFTFVSNFGLLLLPFASFDFCKTFSEKKGVVGKGR